MHNHANQDRAVLITGCSTGIGRASALDLAARGFQVFAGVRKESDGKRLEADARGTLRALLVDVTDAAQVRQAAAAVEAQVGQSGLWGIVNNAGIVVSAPLELVALDQFRRQFEVNLFGTLAITQAVLPSSAGGGTDRLVGSIAGLAAPPTWDPMRPRSSPLRSPRRLPPDGTPRLGNLRLDCRSRQRGDPDLGSWPTPAARFAPMPF